jgi:hypothetical protein
MIIKYDGDIKKEKERHTLACQRSYCSCIRFPINSSAFWDCICVGSVTKLDHMFLFLIVCYLPNHVSMRAHGYVLITSGGSTPKLRHSTRATLTVFIWMKEIKEEGEKQANQKLE